MIPVRLFALRSQLNRKKKPFLWAPLKNAIPFISFQHDIHNHDFHKKISLISTHFIGLTRISLYINVYIFMYKMTKISYKAVFQTEQSHTHSNELEIKSIIWWLACSRCLISHIHRLVPLSVQCGEYAFKIYNINHSWFLSALERNMPFSMRIQHILIYLGSCNKIKIW